MDTLTEAHKPTPTSPLVSRQESLKVEHPPGTGCILPLRLFQQSRPSTVCSIAEDLYMMARLAPSLRPTGIVLTTLNGNHSSPRDTLAALVQHLLQQPTLSYSFTVHDGAIQGDTTTERYAALVALYSYHTKPSPRFVIVPDVNGVLSVSSQPGAKLHYVEQGEFIPFHTKTAKFLVYNSHSPDGVRNTLP